MKNKIVICDWGGVIESHTPGEYNIHIAIINIMHRLGSNLSDDQIIKNYFSCDLDENEKRISEVNQLEEVKLWFYKIKEKININCSFEEFCKVYEEEFMKVDFYKEVVKFIHSLKDKCYIGILSNLGYLDKKRIDYQVDLKKFDYTWLSFELECRKPNSKIYEIVENECSLSSDYILLIDDTKENIEMAKKRGWNTCQAFGYELDKIKKIILDFLEK